MRGAHRRSELIPHISVLEIQIAHMKCKDNESPRNAEIHSAVTKSHGNVYRKVLFV